MSKLVVRDKIYIAIIATMLLVTVVGGGLLEWYRNTFGVSIEEILYTINSPLVGADTEFLSRALYAVVGGLLLEFFILVLIISMVMKGCSGYSKIAIFTIALVGMGGILIDANTVLKISDFVQSRFDTTEIYDVYYEKPVGDVILANNPRNLIYIFLESMETSYASVYEGGFQKNNYIPQLTKIAGDNISFSNSKKLGGFHSCVGSKWTMGAIFTMEAGVPFSFPTDINSMNNRERFASGIVTLGDILQEKGYYQEFLCGSDGNFAGKKQFFEEHGGYIVYDLYSVTEAGYISPDEYVWWGMEDKELYRAAKDELSIIAKLEQPFNFTMLTVDTHHVGGWVCELCEEKYPDQLANVLVCADKQIAEFIEWCAEQPWYENTTIVIVGDHPRMDTDLVEGRSMYDRTVYNCFINAPFDKENVNYENREISAFDMFPTVLASIGFEIPGNRLGLGTNLFSEKKTLCEELGFEYVDVELSKYSEYYTNFY